MCFNRNSNTSGFTFRPPNLVKLAVKDNSTLENFYFPSKPQLGTNCYSPRTFYGDEAGWDHMRKREQNSTPIRGFNIIIMNC